MRDERCFDGGIGVAIENPQVRIATIARAVERDTRNDRADSGGVPGRADIGEVAGNLEERGPPVGNVAAVDAAIDASIRHDGNGAAETDHLPAAGASAITDDGHFEFFLDGLFSRVEVEFHEVDHLFLAAVEQKFSAVEREHADNARPVEDCGIQQFLRGDLDFVVAGEPLGLELVEFDGDAKLGAARALDADVALIPENAGQRRCVIDNILHLTRALRNGSGEELAILPIINDGHGSLSCSLEPAQFLRQKLTS
jgi:hypothetical protein